MSRQMTEYENARDRVAVEVYNKVNRTKCGVMAGYKAAFDAGVDHVARNSKLWGLIRSIESIAPGEVTIIESLTKLKNFLGSLK